LSAELGCPGDYDCSTYTQAFGLVEDAAAATGKMLGTVPHGSYSVKALYGRGHRLFVLGTDRSVMHQAMSAQVAEARLCL